jgi:hypothetical protein
LPFQKSPFSAAYLAPFLTKRSQIRFQCVHRPFLTLLLPCPILRGWSGAGNNAARAAGNHLHKMNFERSLVSWH